MPPTQVWKISNLSNFYSIEEIKLFTTLSTLDELSARLPYGVYTTFRTFGYNKVLPLEPQFLRLEESSYILNKPILINRSFIRDALREVIKLCEAKEIRIRLTVDLTIQPGTIYISSETLITPKFEDFEVGVMTVTRRVERENPKAKQTSFLSYAHIIRGEAPKNVNEILLINNTGQILEGLSSNFFAIKNGEIWTESNQVLSGIVRSIILEEASSAGIGIHFVPVHISEIESLEEAFLTSASRLVLPIQTIDGRFVGTGKPGCITKKLIILYQQRIQKMLEVL